MKRDINFIGSIDDITSIDDLKELYDYGLTTIRLNMSYRFEYYNNVVSDIRNANQKHGINIKLICDLAGKEMRVTNDKSLELKTGDKIIVGKDLCFDQGDLSLLEQNDIILINDGETVLEVEKFHDDYLYCVSKNDSVISPNANVYNEKIYSKLPFISEKDKLNLNDAIRYKADFIAVSHVESKKDLEEIRKHLKINNANIKLISKIENREAIQNLDEIILNSDGIMIARGCLGKILPIYELGYYQKLITEKTLQNNKFLIAATDYLTSLKNNLSPSRADVIDLFTAYNDGIKNIMFSKELVLSIDKINFLKIANSIYESYLKYVESK